jgi:hypothetical protein
MVTKLERENNTIFYLHNAWANSPDGTAGFTLEESEDAAYIGNCISMSSTEVRNPSSYNWIAVEFEAVEESDTAELTELGEDVPEDPEDEDDDYSYEDYMDGAVQAAADTATTAQESADIAQQKAEEATASAALAQQKAEEATASAAEAKTAADTAKEKAEAATTDAATAKQKAEEATSSAALAQQKAESATAAAGAAHTAAESATSDARAAGIAAATAQAAAEAAQGDIDDQKKYFYHDKLGAHVLDAAGGAYRTDIKSDGVQIVQTATETPIAMYGETVVIGEKAGEHTEFTNSGLFVSNKNTEQFSIKGFYKGELFRDSWVRDAENMEHNLDVDLLVYEMENDGHHEDIFKLTFILSKQPKRVAFIFRDGSEMEVLPIGQSETMYYTLGESGSDGYGEKIKVVLNRNTGGAIVPWVNIASLYAEYEIEYSPTTVRIGEGATPDVNIESDGTYYDYKAFKIGKGQDWEGIGVNENAFEVDFDGTASLSGSLNVNGTVETQELFSGMISCLRTINCRELIAAGPEGEEVSFTTTVSGTGTAKATTGSVSIKPKWWRCGNLVQMEFGVEATGAVKPGANIATGTITGIPRPVTTYGLRAASYYGNNANLLFVSQEGNFTVRNCGSDALAKGNNAIGIFTYITTGFILGRA